MDDPIFDPWSAESDESRAGTPRWRSPRSGAPPRPPTLPAPEAAEPLPTERRRRLPGTAGVLQEVAVPALERSARQLSLARHDVVIEDELAGSPPRLRMSVRLWKGPLPEAPQPPAGTLELTVESADDARVAARFGVDGLPETLTATRRQVAEVTASWIGGLVVAFVETLLTAADSFDG